MTEAVIRIPSKLIPVFQGRADVRWSKGGRGSAKTRSFAKMAAFQGMRYGQSGIKGQILCARQFMNSLEDSSLEEVKRAIEDEPLLTAYYEVGEKYVKSKDGNIWFSFAGLDRNIASIKSKGRILICWVDEAEPVTEYAWSTLIPTLREENEDWNAELWVTWNPKRKNAPVEARFVASKDPLIKGCVLNWTDNPKFPAKLERERLRDKEERPDQYDHIWEGDFVSVVEGAYFAKHLTEAKAQGRIGRVGPDPLMTIRIHCDIGGTGARADSFTMWASQFIGKEIRVLNYYEAVGQPAATHLEWLREKGYTPSKAQIWLPHDGEAQDKVHDASYAKFFRDAGYTVTVVPNQGKGAAKQRIEAARRLFPSIWFNEETTSAGRDALGWYHEKRDEERGIGLGPNHDWASHGCFVGETKILTRYGSCRMMDLPKTGEVLTPCGWKQYINPRITRRSAQLVEVRFTDGHSVKCTPDHLFMTASGWKSAESLTKNTEILSTLTNSRNISMAVFTVCGLVRRIFLGAANVFTGMFGELPSETFQKGATSTTGMGTCLTTELKIWSACLQASIFPSQGLSVLSQVMGGSVQPQKTKPLNGTSPQRADFGTKETPRSRKVGPSGTAKKSHACIAVSRIWRLLGKAATLVSTALLRVKLALTEKRAKAQSTLVVIESVRPLKELSDVWDITVPGPHCFSLLNGAVVHNSDSFGLMCITHETPVKEKPIKYTMKGIV